jgi:predicted DNA-binding protein with PD1-like motif
LKRRLVDGGTFVVVLETGEEVMESLASFAAEEGLEAARITGIGAFSRATLGFYERERKDYERYTVDEDVEVLSLIGNITRYEDAPRVHLHAALSRREGSAFGGHLFEGRVGATLELFAFQIPGGLERRMDEGVGLPLIVP